MPGWTLAAAALAAVLLAGIAAALMWRRRGGRALTDPDAAMRAAEAAVPGFVALEALVGDDRRAALVVGRGNRVALATPRQVREVRWSEVRALAGGLTVGAGRPVFVAGVDVLDVRRAGGAEMRR